MRHDPLCSHSRQHRWFERIKDCQCVLINTVRENISNKIIQYGKDTHPSHNSVIVCQRCDIVAAYNYAAQIAKGK
jgi:hypothetical protein